MTRRFRGTPTTGGGGLQLGIRMPRPARPGEGGGPVVAVDPLDVLIDAPDGTIDVPYAHTYSASGGTPPYTWALTPGSLSILDVLSFDEASGSFTGTPVTGDEGFYQFLIELNDAGGNRARAGDAIAIAEPITALTLTGSPPNGVVEEYYEYTWTISGGVPPYTIVAYRWLDDINGGMSEDFSGPPRVSGNAVSFTVELTLEIEIIDDAATTVIETYTWSFLPP